MLRTFSAKLSAVLLALFVAFGLASMLLSLTQTRAFVDEVNQKVGLPLAERISAGQPLMSRGRVNTALVKTLFDSVMAINPLTEMYLLDPDGVVLAHSGASDEVLRRQVDLAPIHALHDQATLPVLGDDPRHRTRRKVFSVAPLGERGARANADAPAGYLYIILGGAQFDSTVQMLLGSQILRWSVWSTVAGLAFASLAGVIAFRLLTRPIRRLAAAMTNFQSARFQGDTPLVGRRRFRDEVDDLTDTFKRMSTQITQYVERLRDIDNQRRELVANVSHDLRTPLAAVQGYLDTMLLKDAQLTSTERRQYLDLALTQSRKVERFVAALLELAQLEHADSEINIETFALCDLVQDVVQKFDLQATERGIFLAQDFATETALVRGDIRLIERLLNNLIDNALQHTDKGAHVTVGCRHVDGTVQLRVQDTGRGIDAEDLPHVFERFYRAKSATQRGSGLGLAISQRIAQLHGQTLTVDSRPGEGTTFTMTLPAE